MIIARSGIGLGATALLAISAVSESFYTIDQNDRAVLLRTGATIGVQSLRQPFKLPWIETDHHIDVQTHITSRQAEAAGIRARGDPLKKADLVAVTPPNAETASCRPPWYLSLRFPFSACSERGLPGAKSISAIPPRAFLGRSRGP